MSLPRISTHASMLRLAAVLAALAGVLTFVASAQAATRVVAPAGLDSSDCLSVPCASFARAYNVAAPGDVISVAPGEYGPQTVPTGSKPVTFLGVPGNKIRQLKSDADNVTFDGLDLDAGGTKTTGAVFEHGGSSNVTLRNSRVGNVVDEKGAMLGGSSDPNPTNVVIDNVEFHDVVQRSSGVHNECIMTHAPGITIRNSTFRNCATMDVSLGRGDWWGQPPYGNVVLENNVFGHSVNGSGWHHYSFAWFIGSFENARVVNNTFENAVLTADENIGGGPYSGVWANNIGGGWQCLPGVTYRNNVGRACHSSDKALSPSSSCAPPACSPARTIPVGWLNPAGVDFRLAATSPAVNAGSAEYAPLRDRLGLLRDARPDAGAYEFGAGGATGPVGGSGGTATPSRAWKLRWARLLVKTICHIPRRGCPASTKLRLRLGRPAKVSVHIQRLRRHGAPKRVRTLALRKVKLHRARRIRAAGLPVGRYRVVVRGIDRRGRRSAPVRLALQVR